MIRRTIISGEVFFDFTAAMIRERWAGVNVSAMTSAPPMLSRLALGVSFPGSRLGTP